MSIGTALERIVEFAYPEVTRGPASAKWVAAMREVASYLIWPVCPKCDGHPSRDCCDACLNVGYVNPKS